MADYLNFPPSGFDWADGSPENGGTASPDDLIITEPDDATIFGVFEEDKDSPIIERAVQGTIKHSFKVDYENGQVYINGIGRGTLFEDSSGIITQVLSSELQRGPEPGMARLRITAESKSFDVPPDEFEVQIVELNPALEKHPRYAFLTARTRDLIAKSVQSASVLNIGELAQLVSGIPQNASPFAGGIGTDQQNHDAALELLTKRRIGEDTFYLAGFKVIWAQYFWMPQPINPGGYIEDPVHAGGLPPYFWSVDQTATGASIFDSMGTFNPHLYTQGISWLRLSDYPQFERTWNKVTHSWIGAAYAHFDADIYTNQPSPFPAAPARPIS